MLTFGRGNLSKTVRAGAVAAVAVSMIALQACASGHTASPDSARPASAARAVTSPFFGMHAPGIPTAWPGSKVGAVNLTTNNVYWPQLETAPGQWTWTHLDSVVNTARSHGARPLLVLGQTPSFHPARGKTYTGVSSVPDMTAWKAYVRQVATRYGTKIDYEIWPEPDIIQNWTGTPQQLAALTIAAAKVIHSVASRAVVVSPAMVLRLSGQRAFMNKLFAAKVGGARIGAYVDAVGIDPYPLQNGTPEDSLALINKARVILHKYRVSKPLWNVEINYGVRGGGSPTPVHWSDHKQSSYLVRNYVLDAGAGLARVYWLGWFHSANTAVQLVKADGKTPTRTAKALRVVQGWLTGQKAHPCSKNAKTHVWSCRTTRSGHDSWVYWVAKGKAHVRAPKGTRHVQTMYGAVSGTHAGKQITVTDAPVRVYH